MWNEKSFNTTKKVTVFLAIFEANNNIGEVCDFMAVIWGQIFGKLPIFEILLKMKF